MGNLRRETKQPTKSMDRNSGVNWHAHCGDCAIPCLWHVVSFGKNAMIILSDSQKPKLINRNNGDQQSIRWPMGNIVLETTTIAF